MTDTLTLVDFLRARLDEDEAVALRAPGSREWSADPGRTNPAFAQVVSEDGAVASSALVNDARHIARHDPARVLADVEAKRRIVDEHTCDCPDPDCGECGACSGNHHADPTPAPCTTLRLLALPYASHPDYQQEWAP